MNKLLRLLIFSILSLFFVDSAYTQFQLVSVSTEPVVCYGESTGTITIEISGGTAPYEYYYGGFGGTQLYTTTNTSHTFTGVKADGFYLVQVKDATETTIGSYPVAVTQPPPLITFIQPDPASICQNTPRELFGNPMGGNGGYIHEWTPSDVFAGPGNVADPVFLSADIGIHNIIYKVVDQKGCEVTQSFAVEVFATITASVSHEDVSCFEGSDGSITISGVSGGSGSFEYSVTGMPWQSGNVFSGLTAGNYEVSVRDAIHPDDCVAPLDPVQILQPASAVGGSTVSKTDVLCFGESTGSLTVEGAGGVAPYQYSLNGIDFQVSGTFENLTAGDYTVTVRDANNCTFAFTDQIIQPPTALNGSIESQTNVSCFNGNDGSVTVAGIGGIPSYQYSIDGVVFQDVDVFNNLSAGNYSITIRDDNGCSFDMPVIITQPAASLGGSIVSQTNVSCFNGNDGSVTVAGTDGTAPYQYSVDGVTFQGSGTFENLSSGSYSVTVRDDNGCTFDVPVVITQPAAALGGSIVSQTNVSCFNGNDGSVTVAGNDGTSPYQYSLNSGAFQVSGTFENLISGNYTVTVRDANGCTFDVPVIITQPLAALGGSIVSQNNVSCFNGNDGSVTVAGNDGTSPYQYSLNGGAFQVSGTFENLITGNYSVTVRDNNGCTFDVPVIITQPAAALGGSIVAQTNVSCFNGNDGSVTLAGSNGTAPYQYSIDGGAFQVAGTFENLASGNYTVTIRDANGCTFPVAVTITQPAAALGGSIVSQANVSCFNGNDGSVTIAGSNGTAPYQYSLDGTGFQGSGTFENLSAGNHNITIRDASGCTTSIAVNITQPATAVTLTINSVNDVSCFGGNDGQIQVSSSGGVNPRRYRINGGALQGSGNFTGLIAGNYTVTVVDNNGCSMDLPVTVSEPVALGGIKASQTEVSCFNGSDGTVTVAGTDGTAPYLYSIDGINFQVSGTFEDLIAGNHTITIRDDNDCTTNVAVNISQPTAALSASLSSTNITGCFGWSNGTITITNQQGSWAEITGNYEYTINGWASSSSGPNFTSLPAGTYDVQIRDADNPACVYIINSALVLTQPTPITADIIAVNPVCFGGTGSIRFVNVGGGTGNYQYSVTGFNTTGQVSPNFPNLVAGTYDLRIRNIDNPACESIINPAFQLTQPDQLDASVIKTDVTECHGNNNGEIVITGAAGGSGLYEYSVNNGATWSLSNSFTGLVAGNYQVMIRDGAATGCQMHLGSFDILEPDVLFAETLVTDASCFNGADGSIEFFNAEGGSGSYEFSIDGVSWQADLIFTGLTSGSYTALIRDMNHSACEIDLGMLVVAEPEIISLNIETVVDNDCFGDLGGSLTVSASGGTPGYIYRLFDGLDLVETLEPVYPAHAVFGGLPAGIDYRITVTDSRGCDPAEIDNIIIAEPSELEITNVVPGHIVCFGGETGSITITATGGTGTIWYSVNGVDYYDNGGNFSNLPAGFYDVSVRDDNGCETIYGQVELTQMERLSADVSVVDVTCFGAGNGIIEITNPLGGSGSYEYSVNGADWFADMLFENMTPGTYEVFIRDAGVTSCFVELDQSPVVIDEPELLEMTVVIVNVDCNGNATGSIEILATGGNGNYQYRLDGGDWQDENMFHGLTAGNYLVEVTDHLGCMINGPAGITEPDVFTFENILSNDESCFGANDGDIEIIAEGGTPPFRYSIDNGITFHDNNFFGSLAPGFYDIVSEDSAGCSDSFTILIEAAIETTIDQFDVSAISCNGAADGSVVAVAFGDGSIFYSLDGISWQDTGSFTGLDGGDYTMMFRDKIGCIITRDFTIVEPDVLFAETLVTDATCFNGTDGSIEFFNVSGGYGSYESSIDGVSWQTDMIFAGLAAGNYSTLIRDMNHPSCEIDLGPVVVAEPELISLNIETVVNNDCFGESGGSITASASGGTTGYTYSLFAGTDLLETLEPVYPAHAVFGGLPAGDYRIVVTDSRGCDPDEIDNISITEPDELEITTVDQGHIVCFGGETGNIDITATGGIGTIWYSVNGVDFYDNGGSFSNLSAGFYEVAVRDDNGCQTDYGQVELTHLDRLSADITASDITCFGAGNGIIEITNPLGGTGSYEYSLNGADWFADQLFENLAPGTYEVFIRDAGVTSCIVELDQSPVVIDEPELLEITMVPVNVDCNGNTTGSIEILATGSNGNYQYRLDGGDWQDENIFSGLTAGTYQVEVTDHMGCMVNEPATVTEPDLFEFTVTSTNETCFGANDGEIEIVAEGGTPPFRYSIDNGATFHDENLFQSLAPGSYEIVSVDIAGCSSNETIIIEDALEIIIDQFDISAVSCNGEANGSVTAVASGGSGSIEYSIDGITWQSAGDFSGLDGGDYTMMVRDGDGCFIIADFTVNEPEAVQFTATHTNITCFGAANGIVSVNAQGGVTPYTYTLYLDDLEHEIIVSDDVSVVFEGLTAGSYRVELSDNNGCMPAASDEMILSEPAELIITSVTKADLTCAEAGNGTITVNATGGTGTIYYSLNNGIDFLDNGGLFTGLEAGTYNVVIRDINGCETVNSDPVELTQPDEIILIASDIQDADCFGSDDGSIEVTAGGGTGLLEYSLDGNSYQAGGVFSGLNAGDYTLYVRDENGCTEMFSLTVNEPSELVLTANVLNTSCNDVGEPQIRARAEGGVAPYIITLYLGGVEQNSFSGIVEDEWVLFEPLIEDMTDYMVTVADVSACGTVSSGLLSTERPAELLTGLVSWSDAVCFGVPGGYIDINADGGSAPFTYILYDGDDNELDQIISEDNARFSDLVPGSYYVTITDVNGCGPVFSDEIIIEQPAELTAENPFIWHVECFGGNTGVISVVSQGGTGAVMYSIDGGNTFYPDGNFSEISAGNYELVLRDDAGCQVTVQEIEIQEPALLEIVLLGKTDFTVGSANETGSIQVTEVIGGVEPYNYSIDNGLSWQDNGYFDNLVEGTYEVIVRDANLCTDTESINIIALTGISAEYYRESPTCFGFENGLISITGQMGTEPYVYSLNDGTDFFESGNFSGLSSGVYKAVVRDGGGLTYRFDILLEDPQLLEASASVTNTWCRDFSQDGPDGMISLEVTGGTGNYSFDWSDGSVTKDVGQLAAGTYSVIVTDENQCDISMDIDVGFEHFINISLINEQSICPGSGATLVPVIIQSGMAASYSWSALNGTDPDPILSPQVFPLISDVYTLRVTDENSCYNEAVTSVNLHPFELLYIGNDTVIFQGTSLELEAKGGEFVSYEWTGSGLSSYSGPVTTATPVNETLYQVYAETANGCIEEASILIGIVQPVSPVSGFTPNNDGVNDFFEIPNAQDYPDIVVEIYTRSGQRVFHSNGYSDDKRWDGTFNGKELPMGTYYFVITLNDIFGTKPVTGPVTIVR